MWVPRAEKRADTYACLSKQPEYLFRPCDLLWGVDIHKCSREQGRNNQEWNTFPLTLADYDHLSHYKPNLTGQPPWGHPSPILRILYIDRRKILRVLGGDSPVRTIPVEEWQIAKILPRVNLICSLLMLLHGLLNKFCSKYHPPSTCEVSEVAVFVRSNLLIPYLLPLP